MIMRSQDRQIARSSVLKIVRSYDHQKQDREILRSRFYLLDLGFKPRIVATCDLGFWRSYDVPSCVVTTDLAILKGDVPRGLVCSQKKDHIEAINNQKDFEINLNSLRALRMLGVCSCGKVKSKAADEVNAVALSAAGADDKAEADLGLWFCVSKSGGVKIITARKEVTWRAVGVQTYI